MLAALTIALQAFHPLTDAAGHEHIAPGRKTDPGPFFDWADYRTRYQQMLDRLQPFSIATPLIRFHTPA